MTRDGPVEGGNLGPSWPSAVVALGLIALVGVMFWRAAGSTSFATIWAGAGTLVGVLIGAVPTYFFGQAATQRAAQGEASARAAAAVAQTRTEAVLSVAPENLIDRAKNVAPAAFQHWGA